MISSSNRRSDLFLRSRAGFNIDVRQYRLLRSGRSALQNDHFFMHAYHLKRTRLPSFGTYRQDDDQVVSVKCVYTISYSYAHARSSIVPRGFCLRRFVHERRTCVGEPMHARTNRYYPLLKTRQEFRSLHGGGLFEGGTKGSHRNPWCQWLCVSQALFPTAASTDVADIATRFRAVFTQSVLTLPSPL